MHSRLLAAIGAAALVASSAAAEPEASSGTGFAIGDGSLIVTSNHVIDGCSDIKVPEVGSATVLKSDRRADLAILKPDHPLTKGLRLRSGHPLKLGEEIVVIGHPLRGLLSSAPTVTTGIVSSLAGLRDDRTQMQISAPVQPGNSGGPVLDRSGNVVGVVESKLNAVKVGIATGDIPQNVNFAVHASILASVLDSYAISYDVGPFETEKPIADIVAATLPAVVVLECITEEKDASARPISPQAGTMEPPTSMRTAMVCGRPVEYTVDPSGTRSGFLGVWTGNWNNAGRLCGGLIVQRIAPDGAAEVIYVYGPSKPGAGLAWKEQRRVGFLSGGNLTFQDDQGSTFVFYPAGQDTLGAKFVSRSGQLSGSFGKSP